ncbi:glycosyltransferase [Nonomuraea sediminis]|uniref:glycosyltransferase n=1 Tax=Nonomuraea sediminis TaxID=2835864 RepID=UPI001BDBBDB5|nr:glycosyltransferase family 2 protein [Nonomuraea sediminis]
MTRIRHNDYGPLDPPAIGAWAPSLTVSVVIPAHDCLPDLERTLAVLAAQTYPAELVEVIVADDGSDPPIELPGVRVVRVGRGWGRGAARQAGLDAAAGDVVHWLDADMLLEPDHLEAHLRWHHLLNYAVVIGDTRFAVEEGEVRPEYTRKTLESTDLLKQAGATAYLLHTGASTSARAHLLRAAGGVDVSLNMAEDTELGYRLAQAGAVFIPDPQARAVHAGPSTVMRREGDVHRHNWSFLGDLVPDLRWLRNHPRRRWLVPYVQVVIEVPPTPGAYEQTRAAADSALAGTLTDAAVTLVGPWSKLTDERRASLDEPLLDLRLLRNLYAHEPRVTFAESAPASAAPAPFLLTLPSGWVLGADTLAKLVRQAERGTLGLVSAALTEQEAGVLAARLERTAAYARAALVEAPTDDLVDELFGALWVSGSEYDFAPADEAEPLAGDPAKWRALAAERQEEIKSLRAEVERLTAELDGARKPPAKGLGSLMRHLRSTG